MLDDTIIAVSTPLGFGGLGVVRLSGRHSLQIAKKIFKSKNKGQKIPPNCPTLGNLYNPENKQSFEEALLTFFPKPRTYTCENMIEISCHGSPVILEEVVRLGIKAGARHANPGEFTLRAYVNGRIDIIQAEAINDIINASSLEQAKISFRQLDGSLSKSATSLRQDIIHILSQIEASIEFPEEGFSISPRSIANTIRRAEKKVKDLISSYDLGRTLSKGLFLAIAGRANVGKSTLFNALLQRDRAIVTPFPGTTRDYLQETIKIKEALFTLTDMAGIGKPAHPVEKEGIERGKKLASAGDGILLVLDASRKQSPEDLQLLDKFQDKKAILLFNKSDLPAKMDLEKIKRSYKDMPALSISALKGTNIKDLEEMIFSHFVPKKTGDGDILLHLRQKLLFEDILVCLEKAKQLLQEGHSEEIFVEEIRKIIPLVGQLTGEIRDEDILDRVFSNFCVGK
jgi:tRNA modification GTPase